MKKLIGLLIAILISSATIKAQTTCLPDSIISRVVDELVVKDYLEKKASDQEVVISTLQHKDSVNTKTIDLLLSNEEQYKGIILSYGRIINSKDKLIRQERKKWILKGSVIGTGLTLLVVILLN